MSTYSELENRSMCFTRVQANATTLVVDLNGFVVESHGAYADCHKLAQVCRVSDVCNLNGTVWAIMRRNVTNSAEIERCRASRKRLLTVAKAA